MTECANQIGTTRTHLDDARRLWLDVQPSRQWEKTHRFGTPENFSLVILFGKMPLEPCTNDREKSVHLVAGETVPFRDTVPFFDATATACRGRVLRDEYGMVSPRRLSAVVTRARRGHPLAKDLVSMFHDGGETTSPERCELAAFQAELFPKIIPGEPFEHGSRRERLLVRDDAIAHATLAVCSRY